MAKLRTRISKTIDSIHLILSFQLYDRTREVERKVLKFQFRKTRLSRFAGEGEIHLFSSQSIQHFPRGSTLSLSNHFFTVNDPNLVLVNNF